MIVIMVCVQCCIIRRDIYLTVDMRFVFIDKLRQYPCRQPQAAHQHQTGTSVMFPDGLMMQQDVYRLHTNSTNTGGIDDWRCNHFHPRVSHFVQYTYVLSTCLCLFVSASFLNCMLGFKCPCPNKVKHQVSSGK